MRRREVKREKPLDDKIAALLELFPECAVETLDETGEPKLSVDLDRLRAALGKRGSFEREKYEFNWLGKSAARLDAEIQTTKRLSPLYKESRDWKNTKNVFVEGDNLDALKLLRPTYAGSVDLIYIDPPYNTGSNTFVYNDDFRSPSVRAKKRPQIGDESSLFHSNWCSMFYSRAILARDFLAEDGAIFVSIDDGEYANSVKILDEVFGRENFVASIVWETKREAKGIPPTLMRVVNHEYILCYSKSGSFRFIGDLRDVADGFTNPDNDPRGPWKRQYLQRFGQGFNERTIVDPETGRAFTFETPYTQEKLERWIEEKRVIFPDSLHKFPARKEFFNEYKNPYKPIVTFWGLFSTKVGSEELKKLFQGEKAFDYAKPLELMKTLLRRAARQDAIVMDFFAGSGTFAHAVMALNAEDGARRRFIVVQAPEECGKYSTAYKLGFRNIGAICRARLRLAGDSIRQKFGENAGDLGFRAFRIK